jgi:hypothetical protein
MINGEETPYYNPRVNNIEDGQNYMETTAILESSYTTPANKLAGAGVTEARVWQAPEVQNFMGLNHFEDYDPSTPEHCAILCNLGTECRGFSFIYGFCWLSYTSRRSDSDTKNVAAKKSVTYWKSVSDERDDLVVRNTGGPFQYQSRAMQMYKSSAACDAYYSMDEPCTWNIVAGTSKMMVTDTFSSGWSTSLPLDDGEGGMWQGSAPSAFDFAMSPSRSLSSVSDGVLTLDTLHVGTESQFPTSDANCGCSYDTYVTSMYAADVGVGYGYYEATFKSTAADFVNAFWFQGDASEVNVLKVEGGKATVSWHCFADQNNQESETITVDENFDVTVDHTATFHWTNEQVTVLIDGKIKLQKATPSCMIGTTMKPLFSVEVGESLPSTTGVADGASFGAMTVAYFRKWTTSYIADSAAVQCTGLGDFDQQVFAGVVNGNTGGGLYKGPVPAAPNGYWSATCGKKMPGQRKVKGLRATIVECGAECEATPGCAGFWWAGDENNMCRLYMDFVHANWLDNQQTDASAKVNNVIMWKTVSSYVGSPAVLPDYTSTPTIALASPSVSAETMALGSGFTANLFTGLSSYGPRAAIDLNNDGIIDFGCPWDNAERRNKRGVRTPKGCSAKTCTTADDTVCPTDTSGALTLPNGKVKTVQWARDTFPLNSATGTPYNQIAWDAPVNTVPVFDADACVKLCATTCTCVGASWRSNKGECYLMARVAMSKYKNQGNSADNTVADRKAAGMKQAPVLMPTYTVYTKNGDAFNGCTEAERQALVDANKADARCIIGEVTACPVST